jgi:hypothetical protein
VAHSAEDDVLVNFVGNRKRIVTPTQGSDMLKFVATENLAGRVMWGVDDYCLGPRAESGLKICWIE